MSAPNTQPLARRNAGGNVWLTHGGADAVEAMARLHPRKLDYEILGGEEAVGSEQLEELRRAAREKAGDLVIILL
ncbi:MAG: hypothetical protein LC672_05530, partial [Acidobacteria bacterium]|nr:hypothetical protein [Acidobacteriota bacterium]